MEWHTLAVSRPCAASPPRSTPCIPKRSLNINVPGTSKDNMIAGRRNDDEAMIIAAAFGR
jgi:hypothetical protein